MRSSVFHDWHKFAVHQRRPGSGCIPTAFEMILRSVDAKYVNFETFQDDFDLDKSLKFGDMPRNNFLSVAKEVRRKYPRVHFGRIVFNKGEGANKLEFVENILAKKQPVILSIPNKRYGGEGWHIMPVVDASDRELILLVEVDESGRCSTLPLGKDEFIQIHDSYDGGKDVAFLESWQPDLDIEQDKSN